MDPIADGVVEVVFGVMLTTEHYEGRPGCLEFRDGRLVALWFGRHAQSNPAGLTVGITLLQDPRPGASVAERRCRAVTRVYSRGVIDSETDLGDVIVHGDKAGR